MKDEIKDEPIEIKDEPVENVEQNDSDETVYEDEYDKLVAKYLKKYSTKYSPAKKRFSSSSNHAHTIDISHLGFAIATIVQYGVYLAVFLLCYYLGKGNSVASWFIVASVIWMLSLPLTIGAYVFCNTEHRWITWILYAIYIGVNIFMLCWLWFNSTFSESVVDILLYVAIGVVPVVGNLICSYINMQAEEGVFALMIRITLSPLIVFLGIVITAVYIIVVALEAFFGIASIFFGGLINVAVIAETTKVYLAIMKLLFVAEFF